VLRSTKSPTGRCLVCTTRTSVTFRADGSARLGQHWEPGPTGGICPGTDAARGSVR